MLAISSAVSLLARVPAARLADLAARSRAGALTAGEMLALGVLVGGSDGESGLGALIDAATEEYGNGTYRVPVRVVGNSGGRVLAVLTPGKDEDRPTEYELNRVEDALRSLVDGTAPAIVMSVPAGTRLDVYEVSAGAGVEVKQGG